jgi:Tfp pilus assembly protein PilW
MRIGRRRSRPDERGATLTELLVAITILSIIILPLGDAVIGFLRITDDTSQRLTESHDAQLASAYFSADVLSTGTRNWTTWPFPLAQSVETNAPALGGLYPCGTAATPAAVVRLAWDDPASVAVAPTVVRVSYVVMTVGTETQLHRILCAGSATPVSDLVVAHNVDAVAPVVSCSTLCTGAPAVPQTVTLTLTIKSPRNTSSSLTVVLVGQRRQT